MPRALTEQEKYRQCQKLLTKGQAVVMEQGIKKISVDDIAGAAGMAKGTFYHHFESKERFLFAIIEQLHLQTFSKSEQMIVEYLKNAKDLKARLRGFLKDLFIMPEMVFFIKYESDIDEMFFGVMQEHEARTFMETEMQLFEKILKVAGVDTAKVKPGVVHNFIHTLYLMYGSDLMTAEDVGETADLMMDSLVEYVMEGLRL